MSADNWTNCPKCREDYERRVRQGDLRVAEAYGAVSAGEWDLLRQEQAALVYTDWRDTLREDYELYGAEDGLVTVTYSCSCDVCGHESHFTYRHQIYGSVEGGQP